jgi:hypothetical protein
MQTAIILGRFPRAREKNSFFSSETAAELKIKMERLEILTAVQTSEANDRSQTSENNLNKGAASQAQGFHCDDFSRLRSRELVAARRKVDDGGGSFGAECYQNDVVSEQANVSRRR